MKWLIVVLWAVVGLGVLCSPGDVSKWAYAMCWLTLMMWLVTAALSR